MEVRPIEGARRARFIAWLQTHRAQAEGLTDENLAGPEPLADIPLHIVDIDNDGKDEYVLSEAGGTLVMLALWVYRPAGEGWVPEETPFEPGQREWAVGWPKGEHLFVRFCGKTYVNFLGGQGPSYFRDTQIWEGHEVRPACDTLWLGEQRRYFKDLFDRRLYDEAYTFLAGVAASCQPAAGTRETWLWMESDLALTAFKIASYDTCLGHLAAARKSPGFARAADSTDNADVAARGGSLRQALAANEALCRAAKAKGPRRDYEFSWLREPRRNELDSRFNGLLSVVAPDFRLPGGELFRDVLKLGVWDYDLKFFGKRYALLSGQEPHDPGNRGFIWIDMVTRQSIVGTTSVITSKYFKLSRVPPVFWQQLDLHGIPVKYREPDGTWREIETP